MKLARPSLRDACQVGVENDLGGADWFHVLPDPDRCEAHLHQVFVRVAVPRSVAFHLVDPELSPSLRRDEVFGTAVPEAAVDEHEKTGTAEDDVGTTTSIEREWDVHPITQSRTMQDGADRQLRPGVVAPIRLHGPSRRGRDGGLRCRRHEIAWVRHGVRAAAAVVHLACCQH